MKTFTKVFAAFVLAVAARATPLESPLQSCTVTSYDDIAAAVSSCTTLTISDITVPAKTTLTLSLKTGAKVTLAGTWKWKYAAWAGPLLQISGSGVTVEGSDLVLNGQGMIL